MKLLFCCIYSTSCEKTVLGQNNFGPYFVNLYKTDIYSSYLRSLSSLFGKQQSSGCNSYHVRFVSKKSTRYTGSSNRFCMARTSSGGTGIGTPL